MSVLAVDRFGDSTEAAYGIFDGDRNEEVSRLLQCTMGDVLAEEIQHSSVDSVYMCNTFLTSHRCVLDIIQTALSVYLWKKIKNAILYALKA